MKKFIKISVYVLTAILVYLAITIGGICKYLKEYGYSVDILPQTLAVYFGFSEGFTVEEIDGETSVFIGKHDDYIYEEIFNKHGYQEIERMGLVGFYKSSDSTNEHYDFRISSQKEWCHWFRVYKISDGYKIEDFK